MSEKKLVLGSSDAGATSVDVLKELKLITEKLESLETCYKELKKENRGLVEIQKRLIHERLGVAPPAPSNEYGATESKKEVKIIEITEFENDKICLRGNTFDYRSAIKSAGGARWEASSKVWSLPKDSLNNVIENLQGLDLEEGKDFVVKVERDSNEEEGFGQGL